MEAAALRHEYRRPSKFMGRAQPVAWPAPLLAAEKMSNKLAKCPEDVDS
jgi:hypothetical protein